MRKIKVTKLNNLMQTQYEKLTDPQWEVIKKHLSIQRKRLYNLRDIVDGILWVLRIGNQWRNIPPGFPPWQSVYYYFRQWKKKSPYVDKIAGKILQQCIVNLEEQLKKLKQEMIQVVETEYERLLQKVTSVAGIGKQVGAALIEITGGSRLKPVVHLDLLTLLLLKSLPALLVYALPSINRVRV